MRLSSFRTKLKQLAIVLPILMITPLLSALSPLDIGITITPESYLSVQSIKNSEYILANSSSSEVDIIFYTIKTTDFTDGVWEIPIDRQSAIHLTGILQESIDKTSIIKITVSCA